MFSHAGIQISLTELLNQNVKIGCDCHTQSGQLPMASMLVTNQIQLAWQLLSDNETAVICWSMSDDMLVTCAYLWC